MSAPRVYDHRELQSVDSWRNAFANPLFLKRLLEKRKKSLPLAYARLFG